MSDLLVVGAGPYGLAAARAAQRLGLSVTVVGRPMSFWREHMPADMFLRSGADWHLDAAEELTFHAFLETRSLRAADVDPIPIALFLEYADWFRAEAGIEVREETVVSLEPGWRATLASGAVLGARAVVAAPGIARFPVVPEWADGLDGVHTCDLVDFGALSGARVLIVGGRQSAYEWAALLGEHGAERVDVVHRHAEPRFARVSWAFTDVHLASTRTVPGYWRTLAPAERDAINRRFWEVGRLTLEYWLAPRLARAPVHRHADTEVVAADPAGAVTLSDGTRLHADRIVFACGYRADLARVPYLQGLDLELADGFPVLDDAMSAAPGLYVPGFPATRDFGPFFGFVRGATTAATLIAGDLERR